MKIEDIITKLKSLIDKNTSDIADRQKKIYGYFTGTSGTTGYIGVMDVKIPTTYRNAAISLKIIRRGDTRPTDLSFVFDNQNTADPTLNSAKRDGPAPAYLYKVTTSMWRLYVPKNEGYDSVEILEYYLPYFMSDITVEWDTDFTTALPSTAVEFTNTSSSLFEVRKVEVKATSASNAATNITATVPDGYTFLCWVGVSSINFLGSPYILNSSEQSTGIFDINGVIGSGYYYDAFYLISKTV